jgi:RNA ligase
MAQEMARAGVASLKDYELWSRSAESRIVEGISYALADKIPPARLLVKPFFHPALPLVGLNYGNAQQLLRGRPEGWTDALRYCRGAVFDRSGNLVALPYPKFFNLWNHEHPEADNPPRGPFEATVKLDGHLGIVFHYADKWRLTTHGSFVSRSAKLGQDLLDKLVERKQRQKTSPWSGHLEQRLTLLVEIIHPSTRIRCDYHGHQGLVLTGMTNRVAMDDKDYAWLALYGPRFGLEVTDIWNGWLLTELRHETAHQKPKDREGFVIRFQDGTRVKLKYQHYLDRMSLQNLSYNALMHAAIDGTLKSKLEKMPEELWQYADDMQQKLEKARRMSDEKRAREYLYGLVPPDKSTTHYRKLCRDYLAHIR